MKTLHRYLITLSLIMLPLGLSASATSPLPIPLNKVFIDAKQIGTSMLMLAGGLDVDGMDLDEEIEAL